MGCCCNRQQVETRVMTLRFVRAELLYDVKNYAYVEADVMGEAGDNSKLQHSQHQLADIAEKGNVDRVSRILSLVHSEVVELLYPYTKQEPVEGVLDNKLQAPEVYEIEMTIPITMSQTTINYLVKLIHEYMVYRVIADWLKTTNPTAAANWTEKAENVSAEINKAKNKRRMPLTRKISTF